MASGRSWSERMTEALINLWRNRAETPVPASDAATNPEIARISVVLSGHGERPLSKAGCRNPPSRFASIPR